MPSADVSKQVQKKKSAPQKPPVQSSALKLAKQIAWPALLLCLGFAIYIPSLKFGFILDDHRFTGDPRIQESGHLFDYFTNYVWAQFTGGPPSFYRPVFVLWLRLNFLLSELSPWGWHLLSITKHLLVAIALWLLMYRLLGDRVAAFAAAALFVLHPSHTESVSWVTVPDPLLTIGLLLALLFYLRYVENPPAAAENPARKLRKSEERKAPASSGKWLLASAMAYPAALLAKETAIVFPVVILVLVFASEGSQVAVQDRSRKGRTEVRRKAFGPVVLFAVVSLIYLLIRWSVLDGRLAPATQHLPWSTVVLSWPATLWFYVKAMLWPVRSYSFADPILIESFSIPGVLLPLLVMLLCAGALTAFCVWAWRTAGNQLTESEAAKVVFGLIAGALLLVLPLLPTLNLNALNPGDFLHGRYVYLPLAGLSMLVAIGVHLAKRLRLALLCAAGALAIAFVPLTWSQEKQWKDDSSVFTTGHELAPNNRPVARNLADTRVRAALLIADDGRCNEAMPVFDEVNREYPDDWYTWAGRGICFVQSNDLVKAEAALHRAADLSHDPAVVQQWQALRSQMGLSTSPLTN
ncbi:MAG TPA: tetratricopeptide repeat protein [Candidatus Sulfotelmatobacter sp.]|nr:tetratricopeptide repeat protein [Candidatus Sulfotelmatobacter sp.]